MLLHIPKASAQYARRLLTLLCCAKRPLTVPELIDGIAVDLGDTPKFNPKRKLKDVGAIHKVCPGLIEVDVNPRRSRTTVRIAHFSVQEYLESERAVTTFSVRRSDAHAEIASICLTYLLEPALRDLITKYPPKVGGVDPEDEEVYAKYPLVLYAAKTWYEHYCDGDKSAHFAEHQVLRLFRSSGAEFVNWVTIWNVDDYDGQRPSGKVPSPVYYASLLGLHSVLRQLLYESPSASSLSTLSQQEISDLVNGQGGLHGNALQAASCKGHKHIVELLLEKGAVQG